MPSNNFFNSTDKSDKWAERAKEYDVESTQVQQDTLKGLQEIDSNMTAVQGITEKQIAAASSSAIALEAGLQLLTAKQAALRDAKTLVGQAMSTIKNGPQALRTGKTEASQANQAETPSAETPTTSTSPKI